MADQTRPSEEHGATSESGAMSTAVRTAFTLLHMHTRTCMCGVLFDPRAARPQGLRQVYTRKGGNPKHRRKHQGGRRAKTRTMCELANEQWLEMSMAGTSRSADRPFDAFRRGPHATGMSAAVVSLGPPLVQNPPPPRPPRCPQHIGLHKSAGCPGGMALPLNPLACGCSLPSFFEGSPLVAARNTILCPNDHNNHMPMTRGYVRAQYSLLMAPFGPQHRKITPLGHSSPAAWYPAPLLPKRLWVWALEDILRAKEDIRWCVWQHQAAWLELGFWKVGGSVTVHGVRRATFWATSDSYPCFWGGFYPSDR